MFGKLFQGLKWSHWWHLSRYTRLSMLSIISIISLVSSMGWEMPQIDVKTTFLNGVIEQEVYIEKPQGFYVYGKESHVSRLKKALNGLKKAPRAWYAHIDNSLTRLGFTKREVNPNLYFKVVKNAPIILLLYVMICFWQVLSILSFSARMVRFWIRPEGYWVDALYLGLEVWHKPGEVFLGQGNYLLEILQRFSLMDCKSMVTNLNNLRGSNSRFLELWLICCP